LNKGRVHFVIVFNLTRFARDKYDHFALRPYPQSLGISLRSATEPIDDTSTGKLMEGVLAAFAQFDNDVRSDRTRAGMRAAIELGRWVFLAPLGYINAPRAIGKSLMPDPERAPIVRRIFDEYATGRFTKQQMLQQATAWGLTNRRGRPLGSQAIGMLLRNPLYAGIVDVPEYGVRAKRGDFEPLVPEELFSRAQAILSGRPPSTTPKQRTHPDFPLRGFVRGESCGRGLIGSAGPRMQIPNRISNTARIPPRDVRRRTSRRRQDAKGAQTPCAGSARRCARQVLRQGSRRGRCNNDPVGARSSGHRQCAWRLSSPSTVHMESLGFREGSGMNSSGRISSIAEVAQASVVSRRRFFDVGLP
jgi:hypothetical protein